ncbi:MAG TPA: 4a-hydroxytetrahydrobiopterin dehydratase [Pirellulales bacterium]|jgi:4a-hydroxytetrahydrobiopterin dehydratase
MSVQTAAELAAKKCVPCEGGVTPYTAEEAGQQLHSMVGWTLSPDGKRIRKEWIVKNFLAGMRFFEDVAALAEAEQHHPDLHLTSYRNVAIELWTHAIGGLSENDFILAVKIDRVPVELKRPSSN